MLFNPYKFKHFYKNKYLVSPFAKQRFALSYNYKYKCLWFRTPKVGSRSINEHFLENTPVDQYIYSSAVGYCPDDFKDWFKFSFVREPADRLVSCWKDKIINQNFFEFDKPTHEKLKDFDNFLSWLEGLDIDTAEEHLRSQHMLIDHKNLDFLGRLETFDGDLKTLAEKIGMPLKEVHQKNTSGKKPVELTENTLNRIKTIYKRDYELFYPHLL
jgi:hypothetical protein